MELDRGFSDETSVTFDREGDEHHDRNVPCSRQIGGWFRSVDRSPARGLSGPDRSERVIAGRGRRAQVMLACWRKARCWRSDRADRLSAGLATEASCSALRWSATCPATSGDISLAVDTRQDRLSVRCHRDRACADDIECLWTDFAHPSAEQSCGAKRTWWRPGFWDQAPDAT
jgi:hypothetical protein